MNKKKAALVLHQTNPATHAAVQTMVHARQCNLANVFLQLPLGGRVHQLALLQFSKGETPLAIGILDCVVQFLCQRAVQSASIVSHVMRSNTFCRFEALQHYGACLRHGDVKGARIANGRPLRLTFHCSRGLGRTRSKQETLLQQPYSTSPQRSNL